MFCTAFIGNIFSFCCCPSPIHLEQYNYMINHEYYTLASLENTKVYQQHLGMCGILCAFYLWLQKSQKKEWRIMVKLELWVDTLQCVRLAWWLFNVQTVSVQKKMLICTCNNFLTKILSIFFFLGTYVIVPSSFTDIGLKIW